MQRLLSLFPTSHQVIGGPESFHLVAPQGPGHLTTSTPGDQPRRGQALRSGKWLVSGVGEACGGGTGRQMECGLEGAGQGGG